MIVSIGEILFDRFPDYYRIGGAPFNVAFHLQSLGYETRFVSRIGADSAGAEIRSFLRSRGMDDSLIQEDPDHPTGEVTVRLDADGNADFQIHENVAYDHIIPDAPARDAVGAARLIYYGSLVQRTQPGREAVQALLAERPPAARCLYDVNLRPNCYDERVVRESMAHCDVLKISHDELPTVQRLLGHEGDLEAFIAHLMKDYRLQLMALTMGAEGSRLYTPEGCYAVSATRDLDVVDTVGAGDAFTAVLAVGYLADWPPARIVETATGFAGRICAMEGAIPDDPSVYDPIRAQFE